MKSTLDRRTMIRTMAAVAVFCAVAYVCQFVFRIHVLFLTFDAKDAVMAVGAMLFGPVWGAVMALIVSSIEAISISGTAWIGWIMNFVSSATFVCVSAVIYRYKRTMQGAIIGLLSGALSMVCVMLLCNLLLTPIYTGMAVQDIVALIPTLLLPFNLTKALLNAGLVFVIYKPLSIALKRAGILKGDVGTFTFDRRSVIVLVAGLTVIAACVVVFLAILGGSIEVPSPLDKGL
ncbi:MAG: ECF transporter S component [Clostridia bacterium]|nr:ECF transporter S component [Clostridia bacterium]